MNGLLSSLSGICAQRNRMAEHCLSAGDQTLKAFIREQADKVKANRSVTAQNDPGDFYENVRQKTYSLLGEEAAADVRAALDTGVICTADHHGAVYCSQSFQGDLLFARLLREQGYKGRYVPILSAGQVELENATNARGVSAYFSAEEKQLFPFFPAKHSVQLACCAAAISREMTDRFRSRADKEVSEPLRSALLKLCDEIYYNDEILRQPGFSDQTTLIGSMLSRRLFREDDGPVFVYIEIEEQVLPILIDELYKEDSLIYSLLYNKEVRSALSHAVTGSCEPMGGLLFRGVDEKGRKIPLSLSEDGFLTGWDWNKNEVRFRTDQDSLVSLLKEGKILPGVFTVALLLFFERGITWMGGMFQSCYLPEWQDSLVKLLTACGMEKEAGLIGRFNCSGYISGPMFALNIADNYALTAGPVEFMVHKPDSGIIDDLMERTTIRDAHLIGLSEMYFDLVLRDEREQDWYRKIAEALHERYSGNGITN